ncbi:MAG TPA: FAD-dependent oxidoreductase, partial [Thermomicrobiales bacterium]|nr:FAD-dependent oxidoreductase [Thermomicrobiales bacterium]
MTRIVVIGGGIVGASAAYHLAKSGAETILVDRKDVGQATAAGAGIVSPGPTRHDTEAFFALATPAVAYYPELVAGLAEIGQTKTGYDVVGELYLSENDEQAAELEEIYARVIERRDRGVPGIGELSWLDSQQVKDAFPAVRDVPRAIHISGAARVDGAFIRDAMLAGSEHHGTRRRFGDAELIVEDGKVSGVAVDGERIEADGVVVAGGAWTNRLLAQLGYALPVAPQRGQILHVTMGETDTSRWPILAWFDDLYMLTFAPNRVVAGATRETGSGFDVRMTPGGIKYVLDIALRIAPGIANGTLHEIR